MKTPILLLALSLAASSAYARSLPWQTVELRSQEGTEIHIASEGYCVDTPSTSADHSGFTQILGCTLQVWFNVANPVLTGKDKVRAVFLPVAGKNDEFLTVDLQPSGNGRFAGSPNQYLYLSPSLYRPQFPSPLDNPSAIETALKQATTLGDLQEVAIVVNGVWLKDPITGHSNFRLKLR